MNGIDAVLELRKTRPNVAVVFLTMHRDPAYLERARAAGGLGYVLKHSAAAELVTAVNEAIAGREYVTPALVDVIEERVGRDSPHPSTQVTPRQREILQLIANGKLTKQIAAELAISDRTVEFHRLKLRQMLGARTTAELVRWHCDTVWWTGRASSDGEQTSPSASALVVSRGYRHVSRA